MSTERFASWNFASSQPEKLQTLVEAWFEEAERNWVLTLDELDAAELLAVNHRTRAPVPGREVSRR